MTLWKKVITSLGFIGLLATGTDAKGDGNNPGKGARLEMRAPGKKSDRKPAPKKDHPDENPPQKKSPRENHPKQETDIPSWHLVDKRLGLDVSAFYRLPHGFKLHLDGNIRGYGFRHPLGMKKIYHGDLEIVDYIDSIDGAENGYADMIRIGDHTLRDLADQYDSDKEQLEEDLSRSLDGLIKDMKDVCGKRCTNSFLKGLIDATIEGRQEQYLKSERLTEKEQQNMQEAIDKFVKDVKHAAEEASIYHTLKDITDNTSLSDIRLGGVSLTRLADMAKDAGKAMKKDITDREARLELDLEASTKAAAGTSLDHTVMIKDKTYNFNHAYSTEVNAYIRLDADIHLRLGKPVTFSNLERLDLESAYVISKTIGRSTLRLEAGYIYDILSGMKESVEIARDQGNQGAGILYSYALRHYDRERLKIEAEADPQAGEYSIELDEKGTRLDTDRISNMLYLFKKDILEHSWYYAMIGLDFLQENHRLRQRSNSIRSDENKPIETKDWKDVEKDEDFIILPRPNLAAGVRGLALNPYAAFLTTEGIQLKAGMMIDMGRAALNMSMRGNAQDIYGHALVRHPFRKEIQGSLELTMAPSDPQSSKKILRHMIRSEQIKASPKAAAQVDLNNSLNRLHTELKGPVISGSVDQEMHRARLLYCLPSSLYIGIGYFGNRQESLHGGELLLGSDDIMLKGGYGYTEDGKSYANSADLSLSARFGKNYLLLLDARGLLRKETGIQYDPQYPTEDENIQVMLRVFGLLD